MRAVERAVVSEKVGVWPPTEVVPAAPVVVVVVESVALLVRSTREVEVPGRTTFPWPSFKKKKPRKDVVVEGAVAVGRCMVSNIMENSRVTCCSRVMTLRSCATTSSSAVDKTGTMAYASSSSSSSVECRRVVRYWSPHFLWKEPKGTSSHEEEVDDDDDDDEHEKETEEESLVRLLLLVVVVVVVGCLGREGVAHPRSSTVEEAATTTPGHRGTRRGGPHSPRECAPPTRNSSA